MLDTATHQVRNGFFCMFVDFFWNFSPKVPLEISKKPKKTLCAALSRFCRLSMEVLFGGAGACPQKSNFEPLPAGQTDFHLGVFEGGISSFQPVSGLIPRRKTSELPPGSVPTSIQGTGRNSLWHCPPSSQTFNAKGVDLC